MIGYLALARDTFDVNYAIDKKNRFERFINSFANDIVKYDRIISNNDIGKEAINFFRKLNCKKFIIAQTTFTDAKFITKFAGNFGLPAIIFYSLTTTNIDINLFLLQVY